MSSAPQLFGLIGFGAALLSFAGILILVLASHPGTRQAYLLIAALVVSMIWSGAIAWSIWATSSPLVWTPVIDALHIAFWVSFVVSVLLRSREHQTARKIGVGILALGSALLLSIVVSPLLPQAAAGYAGYTFLVLIALPLLGLLAIEQVFRNSDFSERRVVQPLAIGVGLIFMLDIFCYSQLFIFPEVNVLTWQLRGIGNAFAAPFVLLSIKRQRDWEGELFLSRQVVFHTASLVAVGVYLLGLGLIGSMVGPFDGSGRATVEIAILLAAGTVFLYALFSTRLRRRFKVFISKHFYRNRYDYRREWLRLIDTLAGSDAEGSLSERSVRALAEIIESPAGELWWADEAGSPFVACGAWASEASAESIERGSVLGSFLAESRWVVDTEEYKLNPELYQHVLDGEPGILDVPSIYVPLILEGELRGIVRLDRRADLGALGYEDHDLLKTAGKQVAVFLAQQRIQDRLSETRQFEAFTRLTAFLMHDLKNMISQQELVVGNARRFKHKPEFVDDAIATIDASVRRMRKVLERLQSHDREDAASNVDLGRLLADVVAACSDRQPVPELAEIPAGVRVAISREKLVMAVTHAIRNAQDATQSNGRIAVSVAELNGSVSIDIADNGCGMTAEFIRERLFRPFDSTKGAQGMGIGAYQVRETLRSAGGDVKVESSEGAGTTVRLSLPRQTQAMADGSTGRGSA